MSIETNKLMNLADGKVLYDDLRERAESVVEVSATEPTSENNKLWIDNTGSATGVQVPTYAELTELSSALNGKQDTPASGASAGKVLGLVEDNNELKPSWVSQPSVPVTDVQVNGTSILSQGVANVPLADTTNPGTVIIDSYGGLQVGSNNKIKTNPAGSSHIKAGTNTSYPLVPSIQHESAFFGLAKCAGDTTQSSSSNAVGVYTDSAKVAIQKMLGIYRSPWELIREDDGTNATSASTTINVDGNGNAFELTDVFLILYFPQQETAVSVTDSGLVYTYYDTSSYVRTELGTLSMNANVTGRAGYVLIESEDNIIYNRLIRFANINYFGAWSSTTTNNKTSNLRFMQIMSSKPIFSKIVLPPIQGKYGYLLYGRRKWWT